MRFHSTVEKLGSFPRFSPAEIRTEVSQARVSVEAAMQAGPVHRAFIECLPAAWRADPQVEIFSRLLWLKEGWYPLGPHYHLDWFQGPDGPRVETLMVLVGEASRTEFVLGTLDLPEGRHEQAAGVAAAVQSGACATWHLEPNVLVLFDNQAWHRARPARSTGWRLLMRAIRGLPDGGRNAGRFTAVRNGYVPETPEEVARYAPYRERS